MIAIAVVAQNKITSISTTDGEFRLKSNKTTKCSPQLDSLIGRFPRQCANCTAAACYCLFSIHTGRVSYSAIVVISKCTSDKYNSTQRKRFTLISMNNVCKICH